MQLSRDTWVLETIASGFKLEFDAQAVQFITPPNASMNSVQRSLVREELAGLLKKGRWLNPLAAASLAAYF